VQIQLDHYTVSRSYTIYNIIISEQQFLPEFD